MDPVIDHLNRFVSDIDAHISFYKNVLGYDLIGRGTKSNGSRYAILKGSGHELFISEKTPFTGGEINFRHIGYSVDDAGAFLEKMKKAGYAPEGQSIIEKPCSRQFYLKDPDGFEIDIIQWTDKEGFYRDSGNGNGGA